MIDKLKKILASPGFWRLAVYGAALAGVSVSTQDAEVIAAGAVAGAEAVSLIAKKIAEYRAASKVGA